LKSASQHQLEPNLGTRLPPGSCAGKCLVITFGMAAMKSVENQTIQAKEINSFPHKLVPISGALWRNIMRRL